MENDVDGVKLPYQLIPVLALDEIVQVLEFGRKKYGEENWKTIEDGQVFYGAALRHIFAWKRGELVDKQTSIDHLAHAVCNLLFLQELKYIRKEKEIGRKEDKENEDHKTDPS